MESFFIIEEFKGSEGKLNLNDINSLKELEH